MIKNKKPAHLRTRGGRWRLLCLCVSCLLGSCHLAWSKAFSREKQVKKNLWVQREVDGGHEGGDNLEVSTMADWKLWTLLFQKVRSFQSWNLELVKSKFLIFFFFFFYNSVWLIHVFLDWWRHLSIERNRYLSVRLFPELSRVSKEQPPIAKFVLRVSNVGPNRRLYISPGISTVCCFCLFNLCCGGWS